MAPVLANIFMGFYKAKWLNEYNLNIPKFYLRYVDDILAAFSKEQDSLDFLNFLNKKHPTISLLFLMYSFQVLIMKMSQFKHNTNRPIQDFS